MPRVRLGPLTLKRGVPCVAASVSAPLDALELERACSLGVRLFELRVDQLAEPAGPAAEAQARWMAAQAALLLTVRSRAEGGSFRGEEQERLALYRALLPAAHAVDVELRAPIRDAVLADALELGKASVVSFHDFERTPPFDELCPLVEEGHAAGATIVKVATLVRDDADVRALARLLLESSAVPLIVIGMGEHGVKTRVLFPALGSLLTFAALGKATAPGQLDVEQMAAELTRYYPDYAGRQAGP